MNRSHGNVDGIICGLRWNDLFGKKQLGYRNHIVRKLQKRDASYQF